MKKIIAIVLCLVFALSLVGCGTSTATNADHEEKWDLIPTVMIDGKLYFDTGYTDTEFRKCGTPDGEITSSVDSSERPSENNQSNFGTGYGYQYGKIDGTIELFMNDEWRIFALEGIQQQMGHPYLSVEDETDVLGTNENDKDADIQLVNIVDLTEVNQLSTDSALEEFYRDDDYTYYFPSIKSEYIECQFSNGDKMKVGEALDCGKVTISDLNMYGIFYWKVDKDGNYLR